VTGEPRVLATFPPPTSADPIQPPPDATLRRLLVLWGYRRPALGPVLTFGEAFHLSHRAWIRVNGPIVVYDSKQAESS
jgi:hypothetical protein